MGLNGSGISKVAVEDKKEDIPMRCKDYAIEREIILIFPYNILLYCLVRHIVYGENEDIKNLFGILVRMLSF